MKIINHIDADSIIFWDFWLVVRIFGHTENATTQLGSIIYSYIRLGYSATATEDLVAALNAASSNATMSPRMGVWNVLVYIQYELIYASSFDCIAKLKSFFIGISDTNTVREWWLTNKTKPVDWKPK